ncbi:MAG: helix-turn-helix domain-containing protein [Syntrophorhabdaceae bacterium]
MADIIKWYALNDIAKHLDVSRDTITKLIKEQNFPAHKVGNKYRFDIQEVDTWVKKNRVNKDNR